MRLSGRILVALAISLFACGKSKEKETKLQRSGDQAAVVMVGGGEDEVGLIAEVEPNNEGPQAQQIALGGGAKGTLEGSLDLDRYLIRSEVEGQLFVFVEGGGDADLKFALQKADGSLLAASDRGPAGTAEGVAGFWLEAKVPYHLEVSEFTKRKLRKSGGREGTSAPYQLRTTFEPTPRQDFEVEPNEDLEGAREVGVGQESRGYVGWSGDVDWWRIPVAGFSEVQASGDPAARTWPSQALNIVVSGVVGVATVLELSTAGGELVATLTAAEGSEVALRGFVPDVASDYYLLKIHAKRSNPEESYVLRVDSTSLDEGQEYEPNNAIEIANPLRSEVGVLADVVGELSLGDVDMFALTPASMNRSMDLRLEGPADADLSVSVVTERGEVLALSETPGLGINEILEAVNVAPNTSPVVILRAAKVLIPAVYKLSVSISEGQGVPQTPVAPTPENPDSVE